MKRHEIADKTRKKLPENFNPMMGSIGMHGCAMSHFAPDLMVTIEEMLGCRQEMQGSMLVKLENRWEMWGSILVTRVTP